MRLPNILYENRYCNEASCSILVCGGRTTNDKVVNDVYEIKPPNFQPIIFPSMLEPRWNCKTALINLDIFVVGGYTADHKYSYFVEMFSAKNKAWFYKTQIPDK